MIGVPSLLLELAFPLFTVVLFIGITVAALRKWTAANAIGVLLVLGFALLICTRFYHQVQGRSALEGLRAEDVHRIRIGERRITKPEDIQAVVSAINRPEWFSMNHGGTARREWLVLDLKSGGRKDLLVARYLRKEGAVVSFTRKSALGTFHDGYAFLSSLPTALAVAGADLPSDEERRAAR